MSVRNFSIKVGINHLGLIIIPTRLKLMEIVTKTKTKIQEF